MGAGDTSTAGAGIARVVCSSAAATPNATTAPRRRRRAEPAAGPLALENIGASIELWNVAADAVVLGDIPVAEDASIGCPFELHVRLEQASERSHPGGRTVGDADEFVQRRRRSIQERCRAD